MLVDRHAHANLNLVQVRLKAPFSAVARLPYACNRTVIRILQTAFLRHPLFEPGNRKTEGVHEALPVHRIAKLQQATRNAKPHPLALMDVQVRDVTWAHILGRLGFGKRHVLVRGKGIDQEHVGSCLQPFLARVTWIVTESAVLQGAMPDGR
jgi:hypothetical protein